MRTYAEVSVQGTALSETALCETHNTPENVQRFYAVPDLTDPGTGARKDCTGNEAIECQECGARA
jgi:hypothetical protein